MHTRRNQTFKTTAFSYKSILETKNFRIKDETNFQILIDIQTQWKSHMKNLIKWVWDVVLKERITTWALFQLNQNRFDWVKILRSILQKEFLQRWQMWNNLSTQLSILRRTRLLRRRNQRNILTSNSQSHNQTTLWTK